MKKIPGFVCGRCSALRLRYKSRCGECGRWNTLVTIEVARQRGLALPIGMGAGPLARLHYMRTGFKSFDDVASFNEHEGHGYGLVRGIVYLFSAAAGCGKSRALIQVGAHVSRNYDVVYAMLEPGAGEDFVHAQAMAMKLDVSRMRGVVAESVKELLDRVGEADLGILDSLQGLSQRSGMPIDQIAHALMDDAHATGRTWIIIAHVNKDGALSGVEVQRHWVDVVLHMNGNQGERLRMLCIDKKNRYGGDCVRFMRMTPEGLVDVPDATEALLAQRSEGVPGSCVTAVQVSAAAAVLIEAQALVTPVERKDNGTLARAPKIVVSGADPGRVKVVLSVLSKRAEIDVDAYDVTVNVVAGGIDYDKGDRGLDAAIALAIASEVRGVAIGPKVCVWGELDLSGTIRAAPGHDERVRAAEGKYQVVAAGSLSSVIDSLLIDEAAKTSHAVEPWQQDKVVRLAARKGKARRPRRSPA